MKEEPIHCLVPFCRGRSWKHRHVSEYLCQRHFKLADPAWRLALRQSYTAAKKAERAGCEASQAHHRNYQAWQHIRRQALARAMSADVPDEPPQGRIVPARRARPDF